MRRLTEILSLMGLAGVLLYAVSALAFSPFWPVPLVNTYVGPGDLFTWSAWYSAYWAYTGGRGRCRRAAHHGQQQHDLDTGAERHLGGDERIDRSRQ